MIVTPSEAKKVAICCWAPNATAATDGVVIRVRNVWGFLGTAGSAANARSFRKYVARSARPQARRMAVVVGLGTV